LSIHDYVEVHVLSLLSVLVCGLETCRCERRSVEAPLGCSRTWKEGITHPFLFAHLGRVGPRLPVGVSKHGVYVGVSFEPITKETG
jgi:hypothetical protein